MRDPRPVVDNLRVHGVRCGTCGLAMSTVRPTCADCRMPVSDAEFGPDGTVFASTVVRIEVADRIPPYSLVYVDLDDGPRILAHVPGDASQPVPVRARVRLLPQQTGGDVRVEVVR